MPAYQHPLITQRMGYGRGCPLYEGSHNRYPKGLCPNTEWLMPNIIMAYTFRPDDEIAADAETLHRTVQRLR